MHPTQTSDCPEIDQEGMTNNKWRMVEIGRYVQIVRCPFDTKEEALKFAKDLAISYDEELEVVE